LAYSGCAAINLFSAPSKAAVSVTTGAALSYPGAHAVAMQAMPANARARLGNVDPGAELP